MNDLSMLKIVLCLIAVFGVNCFTVSESNGTSADDIDGTTLIQMGRKLHKPMLTLLGLAIRNLHPCTEWTQWTKCDAIGKNYFGTRKRTRQCRVDSEMNDGSRNTETGSETDVGGRKTETDLGICEGLFYKDYNLTASGFCSKDYNLTASGFCLKLYVTKKSNDDAETQCQADGGHLINIETDIKYKDVLNMLTGYTPFISIGGRRTDVSSAWEYNYGSQDGYVKWHHGFPLNVAGYLCLGLSHTIRQWFDRPCTAPLGFMCEQTS